MDLPLTNTLLLSSSSKDDSSLSVFLNLMYILHKLTPVSGATTAKTHSVELIVGNTYGYT